MCFPIELHQQKTVFQYKITQRITCSRLAGRRLVLVGFLCETHQMENPLILCTEGSPKVDRTRVCRQMNRVECVFLLEWRSKLNAGALQQPPFIIHCHVCTSTVRAAGGTFSHPLWKKSANY